MKPKGMVAMDALDRSRRDTLSLKYIGEQREFLTGMPKRKK